MFRDALHSWSHFSMSGHEWDGGGGGAAGGHAPSSSAPCVYPRPWSCTATPHCPPSSPPGSVPGSRSAGRGLQGTETLVKPGRPHTRR